MLATDVRHVVTRVRDGGLYKKHDRAPTSEEVIVEIEKIRKLRPNT